MFNKEKREHKRAEKAAKYEAYLERVNAEVEAEKARKEEKYKASTETFTKNYEKAVDLFSEFKVSTLGNKKKIEDLIWRINDNEELKYIAPGNIVITDITSGKRNSFPGCIFISNERILMTFPVPLSKDIELYEYPIATLQSVSAEGNGLTAGKVYLSTETEIITFGVSYSEEVYIKIEKILDELIHGALESRQEATPTSTERLGIAVCGGCRASKILAKETVSNCDYCRQPMSLETYINSPTKDQMTSGLVSSADEIMKFKALLDVGAITQEEFDNKKKKLLE